jgi:5-methylcytosine-specific restriction endonuclease McrA
VCSICGKPCSSGALSVDHKDPVVPIGTPAKDMSWNDVVNRMFNSPKDNLQAVCKDCHKEKSNEENKERRKVKSNG